MQLSLNLQDIPVPEARVWETLDDDQRAARDRDPRRACSPRPQTPPVAEEARRDE